MNDPALSDYEQNQEQLRSKLEGSEDIRIEVPRLPEVNPEVLRDVEPLLFRGFLHATSEINGVSFVFKSLNHREFDFLHFMYDMHNSEGIQKFYDLFLAYGVFMVDGVNILPDRDYYIPEIVETFRCLDVSVRRKIIRYLSEINRRANRAVVLTEVYCMESKSRLRWAQYHRMDLTSPAVTGVAGTQNLGLNWAQLTWRTVNYLEDQREIAERDWENTKFIAGAFAGSKGLSRINNQDKDRREKEHENKLAQRDKILRSIVLGEDDATDSSDTCGVTKNIARTTEELAIQLERSLRGEKDWHDTVVEQHERMLREEHGRKVSHMHELRETYTHKYGDKAVVGTTDLMDHLTKEQVQERIREKQLRVAERLAQVPDLRTDHTYEKWHKGNV